MKKFEKRLGEEKEEEEEVVEEEEEGLIDVASSVLKGRQEYGGDDGKRGSKDMTEKLETCRRGVSNQMDRQTTALLYQNLQIYIYVYRHAHSHA